MMDYSPLLTALLALATALIAYTGVIQKEREHGRLRPLFSVRVTHLFDGGFGFAVTNEGGQPALGVRIEGCGHPVRLDVMKVGEHVDLRSESGSESTLTIHYRGLSAPKRIAVRRFAQAPTGDIEYVGGHDQACGLLNRFRVIY